VLVYPWCDGESLYHRAGAAAAEFRRRPALNVIAAFDAVLDAHLAVTSAGFVAVDLYDGCLLWDDASERIVLIDLDEYRPGPFVLDEDRLPGSTRIMAPEEWRRGAQIDERTTVFKLARLGLDLLGGRPPAACRPVVERATEPDPDERYPNVRTFAA
jgi:hypothetical protein